MGTRISTSALHFLETHPRRPGYRRLWGWMLHLSRSGPVQFLGLFLGFVFAGALVEFMLEGGQANSRFGDFFQAFWFTVVTITTVGYGDMAPTTPAAQAWAMVEMLVGIGLVGIITGNVASRLVERNRKVALGLVGLGHLAGHTVICGWKTGMAAILTGILDANPNLSSADLVLVNGQNPGDVAELKRVRNLRRLHFVFGSHTDPNTLGMANVARAERVIILAEESRLGHRDAVDSRTVLSATTVETLSRSVYTCTELVQPHFARYLRHAQVEEVVLGAYNARSLLVAASLGDGIGNLVTRIFPENGGFFRVGPVPGNAVGKDFGKLAAFFQSHGLLLVGLVENAGNLHERKREKLNAALRVQTYASAVRALAEVGKLGNNVPVLAPPPDFEIKPHSRALVVMPTPHSQTEKEKEHCRQQMPRGQKAGGEHLAICGWKRDMADLLRNVVAVHREMGRPLEQISVVAPLPDDEGQAVEADPDLALVKLVPGEPTDPVLLRKAGMGRANRVLVVDVADSAAGGQEADARNVMVAIAVNELNPRAYKCVELFNPKFSQHLQMAEVEEIVLTQRYQELMLVQAALGTGLSHAVNLLLRRGRPILQVRGFPQAPADTDFAGYAALLAAEGQTLIGAIDHTGNQHARKEEVLRDARVQARISNAVDHLLRLKGVASNLPLLHPGADFIPGSRTLAVVISPPGERATDG